MNQLCRFYDPELGPRWGSLSEQGVTDITELFVSLGAWLNASVGDVPGAIRRLENPEPGGEKVEPIHDLALTPQAGKHYFLAPVDHQEIWAAGVTYERSRAARQVEAIDGGDIYARVYAAERPELFFKTYGEKVVGPGEAVGIRQDASWSVPEPELAVILNPQLEVVGFCVGNDMSSRDIEGANPLYLPQAKNYTACCALGPHIWLNPTLKWPDCAIRLQIERNTQVVFSGETHTRHIVRRLDELAEYLGRSNHFPNGVVLLTGTGIVPPTDFSLQAGDAVTIEIDHIGTLKNPVKVV